MRWSLHVSSQPGGEAEKTGVSTQQTVLQSSVSVSHCHGSAEQRLGLIQYMEVNVTEPLALLWVFYAVIK